MVKTSKNQVKTDEQKIIHILQGNSNKSVNDIAKKCNFSRQKVWRIIKHLEKTNNIWGYIAVVDEEKQGLKNYIILIKRNSAPLTKAIVDNIINRNLEIPAGKNNIIIENSAYLNGVYDWMISFSAEDIKQAKNFCELLNKLYEGVITDIQLLENIFSAKKSGIENPEMEKLGEFFTDI